MDATNSIIFEYGKWYVESLPEDGGRIARLTFDGIDLLAPAPDSFSAPEGDFGLYETRPVYGYDDCFPSVDPCVHPETGFQIPDHGEVCWLPWNICANDNQLSCSVSTIPMPLTFFRNLHFEDNTLTWNFEVANNSDKDFSFQHVMHPMMSLDHVVDLELPEFDKLYDEFDGVFVSETTPDKLQTRLLNFDTPSTCMLYLLGIKKNHLSIVLNSNLRVTVEFPLQLFPTLGIWWNNSGYPDENGGQRCECAFEPIPGTSGELSRAVSEHLALRVSPRSSLKWQIIWRISHS